MVSAIPSGYTPSATAGPSTQSQARLQADIAREVSSAPPGADVQVDYRYGRGPNGELIVVGATTTITETTTEPSTGTPIATAPRAFPEDIVDIRYGAERTDGLTDSERAYLQQLQAADAAIRSHEALHFRAAGGPGQLPEYQTITGPDGKQYAVAGSVTVSGTRGADNEQAAREAATLVAAATAPGDASAADISAARQFGIQGDIASDAAANAARQNEQEPQNGGIVDITA